MTSPARFTIGKNAVSALTLCLLTLICQSASAQQYRALTGPTLLLFDDPMGGLEEKQFGVFRDLDPPAVQFIEDTVATIKLPNQEEPTGFLALLYNVSGPGSYNGWWLKLGDADWTAYRGGEVVLRLRQLNPKSDSIERSIELEQPDTQCTDNFKLELKTVGKNGQISVVPLRMRITDTHKQQQQREGYFDLRVPLKHFGLKLDKVHELVVVFENSRLLDSHYRGALAIRAMVLTTSPGGDVDDILMQPDAP